MRNPAWPVKLRFCYSASPGRQERMFFFEKKNQKTFISCPHNRHVHRAAPAAPAKEQKFFGSFFQKRTLLSVT
jgi:hypothetical protein